MINKILKIFIIFVVLFTLNVNNTFSNETVKKLKATIFVQNNLKVKNTDYTTQLNDYITTVLTQNGFSIIDKKYVIAKVESDESEDLEVKKGLKNISALQDFIKNENIQNEDMSSLRMGQNLNADYLVFATISSLGTDTRTFKGEGDLYKENISATDFTLRVSLKINNTKDGGTIYSDVVTVKKRIGGNQFLSGNNLEVVNELLYNAAKKIGERVNDNLSDIKNADKGKDEKELEFSIESNVDGVTVELDGGVIGTTPSVFEADKGFHNLKISKERYGTWEKMINLSKNGQVFQVTLEHSRDGQKRDFAEKNDEMKIKENQAKIDIAKEQSSATAKSQVLIAEGEKEKRKNSHIKFDGDIDTLVKDNNF